MTTRNATIFKAGALAAGLALMLGLGGVCRAQMVTGADMADFTTALDVQKGSDLAPYAVHLIQSSEPSNIFWPGEKPSFTVQITNSTKTAVQMQGHAELIPFGTHGAPGDTWDPHVDRLGTPQILPVAVDLPASGFQDVTITPAAPSRYGGYALVLDLGALGRQFITSFALTMPVAARKIEYPHFCLDSLPPSVLKRLGVHAIRLGIGYTPTTDPNFAQQYADLAKQIREYQAADVTVLFMVGGGALDGPTQPLQHRRPWLDSKGVMQFGEFDVAWLPSYDADFQEYCHRIAADFGWPKGPITGFSLWNEPWEGISISGWGADMPRYRELYTRMWQGVHEARTQDGVQVLVGGCDSSSNAWDKIFPDNTNKFAPMYDFLSLHYQGLTSTANYKPWVNRKGYGGRVKIWDTESWVANTDDRVAAVVAGDRAAGYDRAMGIYGGNICTTNDYDQKLAGGTTQHVQTVTAWPIAASVGAATHFIGERPFKNLLFSNGLPWVMVFEGADHPDDGTAVVVGDLGEEFGAYSLPLRTARGYAEARHKAALKARLAGLSDAADKQKLQAQIDAPETLSGATMTLNASGDYSLYDFYGNIVPAANGKFVVPLDGRGFFLRGSGKPGSFGHLLTAIRASRIDGIEPLSIVAHDFTAPIASKPTLRLALTNVLNRPVTGRLAVTLGGLRVKTPVQTLTLGANQTREVLLPVAGDAVPSNRYPLDLTFTPQGMGAERHHEDLHADVITRRTITVDGKLDDWQGILPQTIIATGSGEPTLTEKAWLPFKDYDSTIKSGLATAYLAYDDTNFYFAAKVADSTPDPGMVRFATRDDDQYFYPDVSYVAGDLSSHSFSIRWTGRITPKYTEKYTVTTTGDDGVRVFIDGKPLIVDWTDHLPIDNTATLTLTAGHAYALTMEYYNGTGPGTAMLFWESARQPRQLIPADGGGFTGKYYRDRDLTDLVTTRTDPVINFQWADGTYPDPSYSGGTPALTPLTWPVGVRHYTYRKNPDLPAGDATPSHDNIQLAFNVLPVSAKRFYPTVPGTMPGFVTDIDTDYEYALNNVAPQYGGGTEVWRLAGPKIPLKHFYPRQPKSPYEGAVKTAKLVIRREGGTLIYECSIPWTEMPEAKRRIDRGQTIKFSYRVNDNAGGPTMELSTNRSVAKHNGSFHVDWVEHWANELEFGTEGSATASAVTHQQSSGAGARISSRQ